MLMVVLSWENYQIEDFLEKIIILDLGMVFGIGIYLMIFLLLIVLEIVLCGGEILLDVGIGLGVLSIVVKYFGVKDVYVFDLDEVVVCLVKENMDMNEVVKDVYVLVNDFLKGIEIESDVIVVNILVDIILLMILDVWCLLK